jgi:hypothetical protein
LGVEKLAADSFQFEKKFLPRSEVMNLILNLLSMERKSFRKFICNQ